MVVFYPIRPGVYVFSDAQQVELGTCVFDDVALTAAATVVSKAADRVVVDAGSKVLGADRQPWASGFGRVSEDEEAKVIGLSEHHGIVEWPEGSPTPELGAVLHLIPNHVCTAVNLADELIVSERGVEVDRWIVMARGANG